MGYAARITVVCVASLVGGCGLLDSLFPRDLSNFTEFRVDRFEALGLCVEPDSVYSASIEKREDGKYVVSLTVLREIRDNTEECAADTTPKSSWPSRLCPIVNEQPAREMTDAEVAELREVFGRVVVQTGPNPDCFLVIADPCVITHFTWDNLTTSSFNCDGPPRISYGKAQEILGLLESLRID